MATGRIAALDGVRGVAILLVLFHHFLLVEAPAALRTGWVGVDLFFVLSGFLITGILLDAKGQAHYFRNFYARRTLRIFPLYYVFLAATLLLIPLLPLGAAHAAKAASVEGREWFYWLYLGNIEIAQAGRLPHAVLGVAWTLAIEEQFYLVWPLVVLLCTRRRLMKLCGVLFVVALVARVGLAFAGHDYIPMYVLAWCRMDALVLGALVAAAARGPHGLGAWRPAARWSIALGFAVFVGLCLQGQGTSARLSGLHTVGFSAAALFFGGLVTLAVLDRPRWLSGRALGTLGKYSYAMYLLHMPARLLVSEHWFRPTTWAGQLGFFAAAFSLTLALAWLSWHLIERRFLRLKARFQ